MLSQHNHHRGRSARRGAAWASRGLALFEINTAFAVPTTTGGACGARPAAAVAVSSTPRPAWGARAGPRETISSAIFISAPTTKALLEAIEASNAAHNADARVRPGRSVGEAIARAVADLVGLKHGRGLSLYRLAAPIKKRLIRQAARIPRRRYQRGRARRASLGSWRSTSFFRSF